MSKITFSDQELWRNILAGDRRAFDIFYERYWLRMYKAALYYLKDANASEEVVQDVFLLIWSKRMTLEIGNFAGYLNATTRYEIFRKIKAAKHSILEFNEDWHTGSDVVYNDGYKRLNELDNANLLENCLLALPKRCREIFYLSKVEQLSNNEIAVQLGISKHTVENQLTVALKHLKINFREVAFLALILIKIF